MSSYPLPLPLLKAIPSHILTLFRSTAAYARINIPLNTHICPVTHRKGHKVHPKKDKQNLLE